MGIPEEQFDKIEAYLEGTLPDAEQVAFERQLQGDEKLRDLVQEQKELVRGIRKSARLDFQQKMDQWHQDLVTDGPSSAKSVAPRWAKWAALFIAFAVAVCLFWWKKNTAPEPNVPAPVETPIIDDRPVASGRPEVVLQLSLKGTTDSLQLLVFKSGTDQEGYLFDPKNLLLYLDRPVADLKHLEYNIEKINDNFKLQIGAEVFPIKITTTLTPFEKDPNNN